MGPDRQSPDEELERLRAQDIEALARNRRDAQRDRETIERLRRDAHQDRETIHQLQREADRSTIHTREMESEVAAAERIAAAQRALIAQLRSEVGDAAIQAADIGSRLAAAEQELLDLRAIRDALLSPTFVQRDGLTVAAEVFPAEAHVGGDFYFVGDGPQHTTVLAVGDVVGKGIKAARRAAFTRIALASVASFSDDPGQLLRWVNTALVERIGESAEFVTAICITIDPQTRRLQVASAGHHPAVKLSSGDELSGARTGAALGLSSEVGCESAELTLDPGDGALLFTDGIIEARGTDSRFGADRLHQSLDHAAGETPDRIIASLKLDLDHFAVSGTSDDVCLLAARVD
jgi:serine phosphatase RsbU (regulator of sigma subunit)